MYNNDYDIEDIYGGVFLKATGRSLWIVPAL